MRAPIFLLAAAALALAGCEKAIERSITQSVAEHAATPGQEWTMQVVGAEEGQVFLVTGPNGQSAAASVVNGVSTLMGDAEAQSVVSASQAEVAAAEPPPERVAISAPGISLKVSADDDTTGDRGRVRINVGGVSVAVDGDDTGGGKGVVRIAGVNAEAAGKFIDDIEDLSPEVKQQMRAKLGL